RRRAAAGSRSRAWRRRRRWHPSCRRAAARRRTWRRASWPVARFGAAVMRAQVGPPAAVADDPVRVRLRVEPEGTEPPLPVPGADAVLDVVVREQPALRMALAPVDEVSSGGDGHGAFPVPGEALGKREAASPWLFVAFSESANSAEVPAS